MFIIVFVTHDIITTWSPLVGYPIYCDHPANVKIAAQNRVIDQYTPYALTKDEERTIGKMGATVIGFRGTKQQRISSEDQIDAALTDFLEPTLANRRSGKLRDLTKPRIDCLLSSYKLQDLQRNLRQTRWGKDTAKIVDSRWRPRPGDCSTDYCYI